MVLGGWTGIPEPHCVQSREIESQPFAPQNLWEVDQTKHFIHPFVLGGEFGRSLERIIAFLDLFESRRFKSVIDSGKM